MVPIADGAAAPEWANGIDGEVGRSVRAAIARAGSLPVLDDTVQRMLALLEDPDASTRAAVATIEQDPEFAAQLLRLANSAYYIRLSTWKTVRQAFTAVGRASARRLCLECATFRFLERAPGNGSASRGQMHLHAVTVASLASEVARRAGVSVESAHLTGLLHDFGKLVMPLAFGEQPLDQVARAHPGGVARAIAEWEQFGIDHAHAGALYAASCGLNAEVCAAIAYHHGGRSGLRVPSPLAATVQVAEMLAGVLGGSAPDWTLTDEALERIGLERDALDEVALAVTAKRAPATGPASVLSAWVAELEQLAHNDDLTGLLSRRAWIDHARRQLNTRQSGALLICDVDRFKNVNDTFGHAAGNALLAQLAEILAPHGTAGRLGGDEFAIWLDSRSTEPLAVAHTIIAQATEAFSWTQDDTQGAALSIGLAVAPTDGQDLATLLELADAALYQAKHAGGHRASAATHEPPCDPR